MKIAVITNSTYEFKEFVKRTGAPPELAANFHPVTSRGDAQGVEFSYVLYTQLSERNMRDFWELLHICKMRIRPKQN